MRVLIFAVSILAAACTQAPVRAPVENESSVIGLVSAVENAGAPHFIVQVAPQGGEAVRFHLNVESGADLGGAQPSAFAGRTTLIYYTSTSTPFLLDLRTAEGRSLLYDDGRGAPVEGQSIVGILRYTGDRGDDAPEQIIVTGSDGAAQSFTYFVDRRIGGWNGRAITAYYDLEERREITLMRAQ